MGTVRDDCKRSDVSQIKDQAPVKHGFPPLPLLKRITGPTYYSVSVFFAESAFIVRLLFPNKIDFSTSNM